MSEAPAVVHNSAMSRQLITIDIPELFNPHFLDVLLPPKAPVVSKVTMPSEPSPSNPMMDALKSTASQTLTANGAPAYKSTGHDVLDAFQFINNMSLSEDINGILNKSWSKDSDLTLRLIWNMRSIHDGKGQKEVFYRAFGWLLDNHPITAIENIPQLVRPLCSFKAGSEPVGSHGYWKDLVNILGLAATGELISNTKQTPTFLNHPRHPSSFKKGRGQKKVPRHRLARDIPKKEDPAVLARSLFDNLSTKLQDPVFAALYIAVARLFAEQLSKDMAILHRARKIVDETERFMVLKDISYAAKWAPTPHGLHDRHTNISTAISLLLPSFKGAVEHFPSVLNTHALTSREVALAMRQFFQKHFLTPLREATHIAESFMSSNKWSEIIYSRVPSVCMHKNTQNFFLHDEKRFEKYLLDVEQGKRTVAGATLMPHEIVFEVCRLQREIEDGSRRGAGVSVQKQIGAKLAPAELRVVNAQWNSLVTRLKEAGTLENSIAVCDVSGSMGSIHYALDKKNPSPILPAISLSLLLASVAKPPFDGGFITFSAHPQFVQLDLNQPLPKLINEMSRADWGANTNLEAVFTDLLLPLAKKHNVSQEDMIKRLFVFSDMQFDAASGARRNAATWETNYDNIVKKYQMAGYDAPEIVYWDLQRNARTATVEAGANTKGVAMMNGFSPAMLKVFMGEQENEDNWVEVGDDGEAKITQDKGEEFNPINVMNKALMKTSYDALLVRD